MIFEKSGAKVLKQIVGMSILPVVEKDYFN